MQDIPDTAVCDSLIGNLSEIFDPASRVIEKPAICVELKQDHTKEIYYYRSIDCTLPS